MPLGGQNRKGHDVTQGEQHADTGVFYINLDRVPERRAFMEAQFAKAGVQNVTRFSAVDARQGEAFLGNGYVPGVGSRWGLKQSEIACFESHRGVWQAVVEHDLRAAAIFEDDVEMSSELGAIVDALLQGANVFDFVKMDYSPRSLRFGAETEIGGIAVRTMMEMAPSAAAYVVSNTGCRKLLHWSDQYSDHLDDFVSIPRPDWRMFQVFPAVGVQMIWSKQQDHSLEQVKTSEREGDTSTNSGLDKGPFWFRIKRELRAAKRKLGWRLGGQDRLLREGGFVGFIPCADDLKV